MYINHLLKLNSVIFYVVPAKSDTPIHWTCRHVWEIVTVMSGTDGVQTSNRRECPQPRPICEREGGESWVSSLRRGSLFPVLKISVRHRAGDWDDMKIKAERKSNVCWRQRQMKRWLGDISIECLGLILFTLFILKWKLYWALSVPPMWLRTRDHSTEESESHWSILLCLCGLLYIIDTLPPDTSSELLFYLCICIYFSIKSNLISCVSIVWVLCEIR